MADYLAALRSELLSDPLTLGYAGMSDSEAAASLNGATRPAPIQSADVRRYLLVVGKWAAVKRASMDLSNEAKNLAAIAMVDALDNLAEFDMGVPAYANAIASGLDALVSVSLISSDDKTAILALGSSKRSRAQELGLGVTPTAADVAAARA